MPCGLYDVHDRAEVFTPEEIAAGKLRCDREGLDYINDERGRTVPTARFVEMLQKRWKRAQSTGMQIDAIRSGYCTIEPKGAAPPSMATH